MVASAASSGESASIPAPPRAKKVPYKLPVIHGDEREDPYYWLRDDKREDPEVLSHIQAENEYTQAVMADSKDLQETLYKEMRGRIKEEDQSVPLRKGPFFYYKRTEEGKQYSVHCRRKIAAGEGPGSLEETLESAAANEAEEILLDENEESKKSEFYQVRGFKISPNHKLLAYAEDTVGGEKYTLHIKDLASGQELLTKPISDLSGSVVWANDNETLFYTTKDHLDRPFKLWRHKVGTDPSEDALVFHEEDDAFYLGLGKTESDRYIIVSPGSAVTSNALFLDADKPEGELQMLTPRVQNVEVNVTHSGGHFLITRRSEELFNSELLVAPVTDPTASRTLLPHDPSARLDDVEPFERHIAIFARDCQSGLTTITVYDLPESGQPLETLPEGRKIQFDESAFSLEPESSQFKSHILRFGYTSLKTPYSTYDYDLTTGERALKKVQPVLGGFDPAKYRTARVWATSEDGTKVPISLVWQNREGSSDAHPGAPGPLHLYGYGSYEIPIDASFSANRLALIDRGVTFAIAHIRGGGDLGRKWYENGKYLHKKNTFVDFVSAAEHLIKDKWTTPNQLSIEGRSAGGLLIGATLNLRPDLFQAALAGVPFVDVLTTMLDPTIPLTTIEWEEWGNPQEEEYYRYMKSYSPIDNVKAAEYPNVLVTAGLHDPRVGYWEPAKWVAKLREAKTDDRLLMFKCDTGAGHFSKSGRFDKLQETAFEYAFLLKCLGVAPSASDSKL
ncbi:Prolyl oligopeptidase family protein [Klebsormidium nitens]|uniref:Prolyl endopeptidase n=1 Tax=Klebsormidium nitens TaxID=105231 RepID=A0A0U9HTL5_KLENI|nr:Prolyl oligopeptidase family protein [Klebsormidium nitens]|eukprot:GAQ79408.1 Prolyl oligopeptidase family protein [Klebsormidium nitens]